MVEPVKSNDRTTKNTPGALARITALEERIDVLEATIAQMVGQLNQTLESMERRGTNHAGYIQALVNVVGEGPVNEQLKIAAAARVAKEVAEAKGWFEAQKASGALVLTDVGTEDSFVIGVRTDKDGKERENSHVQVWMRDLLPDVKAKYLGQGPGAIAQLSDGDSIEALEFYVPGTPKAVEAPAVAETVSDLEAALQGETGEDAKVLEFPMPAPPEDESSKKTEG